MSKVLILLAVLLGGCSTTSSDWECFKFCNKLKPEGVKTALAYRKMKNLMKGSTCYMNDDSTCHCVYYSNPKFEVTMKKVK